MLVPQLQPITSPIALGGHSPGFLQRLPHLTHEHPQGLASKGNLLAASGTYRTFHTGMLAHTRPSRAWEHFRWFLLTSFQEEIVCLISPRRTWCSLELIALQPQLSGGPRKTNNVICDLHSSPCWWEGAGERGVVLQIPTSWSPTEQS